MIEFGGRRVGNGKAVLVAEAGTLHADEDSRARLPKVLTLIELAHAAGADVVKFQCFTEGPLLCPIAGDADRWERWKHTIMSFWEWQDARDHADNEGIGFMLSVFQPETVEWAKKLGGPVKVASRAAPSFPWEDHPGPFLISMGRMADTDRAQLTSRLAVLQRDHLFLQCVSQYPTPLPEARWKPLGTGLSDHSGTPWPALDAIARGCPLVEVHFDADGFAPGPDTPSAVSLSQLGLIADARDGFAALRQD